MSSAKALAGIDEDALAWVRGALEDAAEDVHGFDEFAEVAGPIVEAGCADCDDLDPAAVVRALWAERSGSAAEPAAGHDEAGMPAAGAEDEPDAPAKLDAAVSMATSAAGNTHAQFASAAMLNRSSNPFLQQNSTFKLSERDLQKAVKTAEKRAKKLAKAMAKGSEAAAAAMEENQSLAAAAAQAAAASAAAAKADSWSNGTINLPGIHVSVGGGGDSKSLLRDTTLRIVKGRRYGLVAPNGSGKTVLLRHIAGRAFPGWPPSASVLHLSAEVPPTDTPVLEAVLTSNPRLMRLWAEEAALMEVMAREEGQEIKPMDNPALPAEAAASIAKCTVSQAVRKLSDVHAELEALDAYAAEARAASILAGLGFPAAAQRAATKTLSGGWRMRVALAQALFIRPDILLADEPTVHLDYGAIAWLSEWLECNYGPSPDGKDVEQAVDSRGPSRTLILVCHDRRVLNTLATDIVHLHDKQLTYYRGNVDAFDAMRTARALEAERNAASAAKQAASMRAFVDRFRANANRAAQAQSKLKALNRLEASDAAGAAASAASAAAGLGLGSSDLQLSFPDPGTLGMPVIQAVDVGFGYGYEAGDKDARMLWSDVSFSVDMKSRIALVGANGSGKTTLVRLLAGELEPVTGYVTRNPHLRLAVFSQHHVADLKPGATPLDAIREKGGGDVTSASEQELRTHFGRYGLSGNLPKQDFRTLSGGQRARVALAIMSWRKPHVLILDEPTNFLDLETSAALAQALVEFPGGVLVVSHDADFVEKVTDELWVVGLPAGHVTRFRGDLDSYAKRAAALAAEAGEEIARQVEVQESRAEVASTPAEV